MAFDGQSDQCPVAVPSLEACRPGVDVKQIERLIELHFEYMRVARDEELGWGGVDEAADGWVIVSRIAADVLDEHVYVFAPEAQQLPITCAQVGAVAVSADGSEAWPHGLKAVGQLRGANVAGVPDLITAVQIVHVAVVPIRMRVADDADSF